MKAPPNRSLALLGVVLVCATGFTPMPPPTQPQTRSLVIDIAPVPSSPSPKSEQLMFKFMVTPIMREMSDIDRYLSESQKDPLENHSHLVVQVPCTILRFRYDAEPVHKPP